MSGVAKKLMSAAGGADPAWDISTAAYSGVSFSVAAQEANPIGLFVRSDGLKMYIVGSGGDEVNEYDLSTAWDISTATFLQLFSVAAQDTGPTGVFFKTDGTKMYVSGAAGDDINEYNLSTAWDISTASFLQLFSVAAQDTIPRSVFFKPDGTRMYFAGVQGVDVNEYVLSTAWDISTASFLQNFSVSAQDTAALGLFLREDGRKMYVVGGTNVSIYEYDLSTPWDISSASYLQLFSVAAQDGSPNDVFFKDDGLQMLVIGGAADSVYSYTLGVQE